MDPATVPHPSERRSPPTSIAHDTLAERLGLRRASELLGTAPPTVTPARRTHDRLPLTPDVSALLPPSGVNGFLAVNPRQPGATSLLWRLLAGPTTAEIWCGLLDMPELHPNAAAAAGVNLDHLARITTSTDTPVSSVVANAAGILVEGLGVLVLPSSVLTPTQSRRLAHRARRRGCLVVLWGSRQRAVTDVVWNIHTAQWFGLRPNDNRVSGSGLLRGCRLSVTASVRNGDRYSGDVWPYGSQEVT
ncbi:hypothetical protein [Haloglycomyces albus]|uniref:hypothetical protein n=1 Tax=Haloglycomyces albus TaxID=526067 RepID=UPI00046D8A71|nr:hypothetical protein [Haloglycomyces albus]